MRVKSVVLIWIAHLQAASALYSGKFCPAACDFTLNYATFNDTQPLLPKKIRSCRSDLRITSVYLCFAQYCENDDAREKWIRDGSHWCNAHAGVALPDFHEIANHWTAPDIARIHRMDADEAMSFPVLLEFALPDASFFERAFITMDVADRQYIVHLVYGWCMYYFWIAVITTGISSRLLSLAIDLKHKRRLQSGSGKSPRCATTGNTSLLSFPTIWIRRYFTIPAAFGNRCSQPYGWCTIPPRTQSLTIACFIALNVLLCTCSYELTDGNLYWPEKSAQLLRFVSDRTGVISLVNFPLVWLFGMRNDALMWMTGWGFGTYNAFHRWVARIATLQAVVHSLGYTLMIFESGGWSDFVQYLARHYFWNGELATIAMCALLAFSFYGIRRAHYEIFLVTHIVLSIVALWTMYYHVEIFKKGDWNIFIWPCLLIWIFDRVLRAGRIIAFNRSFWKTKATVSYDPASNLVRMDVDGSKNWLSPRPGTYYYIHVLNDILYAHQNHPFTLAYMNSDAKNPTLIPLSPVSSRPSLHRTFSDESTESDALLMPTTKASASSLVFLIRPYDGFTSRLKSHCLRRPKDLRVFVEGPYGHSEPLHLFPNILFIVGGTGVAVTLSHISRLLSSASQTQSIKIVWAVREHAFLASILRDFSGPLGDERVDMEVRITQASEVMDEVLGQDLKSVRIVTKRPDVYSAVHEAAQNAGKSSRLAIVACGPAGMADQARQASVEMLAKGYRGIEYLEESFKW